MKKRKQAIKIQKASKSMQALVKAKARRDPLYDIGKIAVKTGIKDFARKHDTYLHFSISR